jgi:hypothetical protein
MRRSQLKFPAHFLTTSLKPFIVLTTYLSFFSLPFYPHSTFHHHETIHLLRLTTLVVLVVSASATAIPGIFPTAPAIATAALALMAYLVRNAIGV